MSNFAEIKTAVDAQGRALDAFTKRQDATLNDLGEDVSHLRDRIEYVESRASNPGKLAGSPEQREHKARFESWLRAPHDSAAKNALGDLESQLRTKAVNIGTASDGGFAVPEEIARDIERLELKLSPVRRLVRVVRVGSGDYKHLVNVRGATSGWVGESDSRTETTTPSLREVSPTFGELYSYPQAREWSLDDVFFDVGAWLAEEVSQDFAQAEGTAVISGDGSNKPTGMLNTTPVATDDFASPLRPAAAYEFIASLSNDSPAVAEIMPDELISLVYSVNSAYRAGATFVMNSTTAAAIRKIKDSNGQYLWQAGLGAGQPDRLLGYPVETWEQMQDIATNAFPVAFGDFRRGYILADRTQVRITIDANLTTPGRVKFFVRRRVGGFPLNGDAIKFLRTTIA